MHAAEFLFWTLGTISFTWTMGILAIRKSDLADFFAEFIRFILFFGLYYWLLKNGARFSESIVGSLHQLGMKASGQDGISPSGIVNVGFMLWKQAVANLSVWSPVDSLIGLSLSIGILILLALTAINMLLILISSWILMYAGIFFLGFGGSRWTSDIAINYFKAVLGVGIQLFAMVLLVGIGNDMLLSFYKKMAKTTLNFEELGVMLVFCLSLLVLASKVPAMLANIVNGGGLGAGAIGGVTAGAVVGAAIGAASTAAAAAGVAGRLIGAGAAGMAGGAQALMAAFSKANGTESAGGSSSASLMGEAGGAQAENDGRTDSGGDSPLAAAMGDFGSSGGRSSSDLSFGAAEPSGDASSYVGSSEAGTASSNAGGDSEKASDSGNGAKASRSNGSAGAAKSAGSMAAAAGAIAAKAGRVAAKTGVNLAQGAWDVSKGKVANLKDSAMNRIGETTGGKIAAAIKAREGATESGKEEGQFGDDSLSAGSTAVDAEAEIAAFRDRDSKTS